MQKFAVHLLFLAALLLSAPLTTRAANSPPTVFFPFSFAPVMTDDTPGQPLQDVEIDDNDNDALTIEITFPAGRGTFPTGGGITNLADGDYIFSAASPADAQSILRALQFTPIKNRIPLDESETTRFTVTATDPSADSDSDFVDQVVFPVNDPPAFAVTLPSGSVPDDQQTNLLSNITIQEDDVARYGSVSTQHVTADITLSEGNNSIMSLLNGSQETNHIAFSGAPSSVVSSLRSLKFVPHPNRRPVGLTENFTFPIVITDDRGLLAAGNGNKTVSVISINDPPTLTSSLSPATTDDLTPVMPFHVTAGDVDLGETLTLTIDPTNSPYGSISPAGPFTGSGSTIQAAVAGVRFAPIRNSVAANQPLDFHFNLADSHGASIRTTNTFTITGVNDPPDIAGVSTSPIRTTDDPTLPGVNPFPDVRIIDADEAGLQQQTVTITSDNPSFGTLSSSSLSGTPDQVTALIRAVNYKAALRPNRVMGQTVTATLTILAVDSSGARRSNNVTRVAITSVNGAPVISGVPPPALQPLLIPPTLPLKPFAGVSVTDDDMTNVVLTITIDNPAKGSLTNLGGFISAGSGVYKYTNLPAQLTMALTNLQFQLSPTYLFPPNAPGGTKFTIEAVDFVLNRTVAELSILVQNQPLNHFVTRVTDDRNSGSLRHALEHAQNNDVVTFALQQYPDTIQLDKNLGPFVLLRNVTLRGPGADLLSINGDSDGNLQPDTQLFRIFASVTIDGLTLTRGSARGTNSTGGAAYVGPSGALTLRNCAVTDCEAAQWGGAIDVDQGQLTVERCFIARNTLDSALGLGGGAISLYTTSRCAFVNTTFSANHQACLNGIGGGAIYAENFDPSRLFSVEITHCTFAENDDASSGGSGLLANVSGTFATIRNSIFADGLQQNIEVEGSADIISEGGNVSDDNTRAVLTQGGQPQSVILLDHPTDRINTAPRLMPLDEHVRPTPGYPLQAGSPAIGLAVTPNPPAIATDQRGGIRTNRNDSGSLEFDVKERIVLNEIHFDPKAGEADFVEFYATRDSMPVNLSSFTLFVDGTNRHTFAPGTFIQPGQGIIVADSAIPVIVSSYPPTPVNIASNGPLKLLSRGRVELKRPDGGDVIDVSYVGVFADLAATTQAVNFANNSITLAPQFRGSAYVPNSLVLAPPLGGVDITRNPTNHTSSPGADAIGTPFGLPNELPLALNDQIIVSEDTLVTVPVLANDLDGDGLDQLVIVDVSRGSAPGTGDNPKTNSLNGALVSIDPTNAPLRGSSIIYDPRAAAALQRLPEGAKTNDSFYYEIIDIGTGPIQAFQGTLGVSPTTILSPGHRLTNGDFIIISGSGVASYNGTFSVTNTTNDTFTVPVQFTSDPAIKGSWITRDPRHPSARSEGLVTITVLGANDPPTPANDVVTTDEETIIRIMGDAALAGSSTVFATDSQYPVPPRISSVSLLANDTDPDTDDNFATLHIVGIVSGGTGTSGVNSISNYASANGGAAVLVTSPSHGLAEGSVILISGYGGHPSYDGFHIISVVDSDSFTIPVPFVDNNPAAGVWAIPNDANPASQNFRLAANSKDGAAVKLEIRADRIETSIVYNPRTSEFLNGLTVGETNDDKFYYAVQDRHGAVSLAAVTVRVAGVNDPPEPKNDPSSLGDLTSLVNPSNTLAQVIAKLVVDYALPPGGTNGAGTHHADVQTHSGTNDDAARFFLTGLLTTDEDTALEIDSTELLANDGDVDRSDAPTLIVKSVTSSHEGATVTLDTNRHPAVITYDPRPSARLDMLAREEMLIDTFEMTVTDSHTGGDVTTLAAVLVVGVNDTPVAQPDSAGTKEDVVLVLGPDVTSVLFNDSDVDIDGHAPDNRLRLVPVSDAPTPGGARVTTSDRTLIYNPTNSAFLDGLAFGQSYTDHFEYVVMDSSFIFANDDHFQVEADGADFVLDVLANDVNLTGIGGALHIVSVGTPSKGGTNGISGNQITYTPRVTAWGDEVFTYTVSDEDGNLDTALVTVRITDNQLNGNLQANNDHFTVAKGQSPVLDVLANDNIVPDLGSDLSITRFVAEPLPPDQVILSNNVITFVQRAAGPFPYTTTFRYEISGGGTARAIAEVTVTVTNRENTLTIRNDTFAIQAGSQNNILDVLANDNILPGTPGALTISAVITSPTHGTVATNDDHTSLFYTPDTGFIGQDSLVYMATDDLGGTGTGVVTIAVGTLTTASDFFAVPYDVPGTNTGDGAVELDVLANDGILQGPAGDNILITSVTPTTTTLGTMSVKPGGAKLLFDAAEGRTGEAQFTYRISDGTGRTAEGTVTVVVVQDGVTANGDFFTVAVDSSVNALDVLLNDVALPDFGLPLTIVSVGSGLDGPNHGGTVQINATSDRLIYTPAPGFSGEETFTYTMTDSRKIDTAKVVVRVTGGAITANEDAFTVFFEPVSSNSPPRQFTLPVLANDRVIPEGGQLLTIIGVGIDDINATNAPDQQGLVSISGDGGSLLYAPRDADGPFPYVERFTYEITDGTERRAQGVVRVTVLQRTNARDLETSDDAFSVQQNSQSNILAVLVNDAVKPASAAGWTITSVSPPTYGDSAQASGDVIIYTPHAGFVGTDEFTYSVSDGLGGTGSATVRVKVGDRPLSDDVFTVLSGSVDNVFDVTANDGIRPAIVGSTNLQSVFGFNQGGSAFVSNNVVFYTPSLSFTGAYPYVERFFYRVVDDSSLTFTGNVAVTVQRLNSDRTSAILSIIVDGVNDAPTIAGTGPVGTITDKQTIHPFPNVTIADIDDQGNQLLTLAVSFDPGHGVLTNLGGFAPTTPGTYTFSGTPADVTTALRALVYDPIENRITVPTSETTTFTLSVDDHFVTQPVTDSATTVTVVAVNDPPVISGTLSNITVYHHWSVKPFAGVTITEVDDYTLQLLAVTVTLDNAAHGFITSLGAFVDNGGGVYAISGVTAAEASAALRVLVFVPTTNGRIGPGQSEATHFQISVNDGFAPPVTDNNTIVTAIHEYITKITANDGATGDNFGAAVAASADVVVVGAPMDDDHGNNSGAAYIFIRDQVLPDHWTQFQKLVPADGAAGDQFGGAVSISGPTIAVSARFRRETATAGVVYLFERTSGGSSNWVQSKKIIPFDGANSDDFGVSVSIDMDTLVVGADLDDDNGTSSGSAYLYARNLGGTNNWGLVKKLHAGDAAGGDQFGHSVSVNEDTVVVGAHLKGGIGSAYVFSRNQGGVDQWGQVKRLQPSDGLSSDNFGFSVSVYGDTIMAGSPQHDAAGQDAGATYVFERDLNGANNWGQRAEILSPKRLNNDQFGYSVSISREKFVGGLPFSGFDNQSKFGAVFAFGRDIGGTNNWGTLQELLRPDPENNDQFGYAVNVGQDTAVVGVAADDDRGSDSGSAYIYRFKYDNAPLLLTPIPDQTAITNTPFTFTLSPDTFADPDVHDTLTLSATLSDGSPLPGWLSFSPDTGTFSGTPPDVATYIVRVTATDEDGASATGTFTITVSSGMIIAPWIPVQLYIADVFHTTQVALSYDRARNSRSQDYFLETSTDLFTWVPGGSLVLSESVIPTSPLVEHVTLRVPKLLPAQFFRMKYIGN